MEKLARYARHTSSRSLSNFFAFCHFALMMNDNEQQEATRSHPRPSLMFYVCINLTSERNNQTLNSEDFKPRGKCVCLLVKLSADDALLHSLPKQCNPITSISRPAHSQHLDQRKGIQLQPYAGRAGTREREKVGGDEVGRRSYGLALFRVHNSTLRIALHHSKRARNRAKARRDLLSFF